MAQIDLKTHHIVTPAEAAQKLRTSVERVKAWMNEGIEVPDDVEDFEGVEVIEVGGRRVRRIVLASIPVGTASRNTSLEAIAVFQSQLDERRRRVLDRSRARRAADDSPPVAASAH